MAAASSPVSSLVVKSSKVKAPIWPRPTAPTMRSRAASAAAAVGRLGRARNQLLRHAKRGTRGQVVTDGQGFKPFAHARIKQDLGACSPDAFEPV